MDSKIVAFSVLAFAAIFVMMLPTDPAVSQTFDAYADSEGEYNDKYAKGEHNDKYAKGEHNDKYAKGEHNDKYAKGEHNDKYAKGEHNDKYAKGEHNDKYAKGEHNDKYAKGEHNDKYAKGEHNDKYAKGEHNDKYAKGEHNDKYYEGKSCLSDPSEEHSWKDDVKWNGEKYSKKGHHGHETIIVEGFTGTIPVPEGMMTKEAHDELKGQVTVSLGQAVSVAESNGVTDAMKASIGIAKDGKGNKYVVWTITSINKDEESKTMTVNIFVVDAGDAVNFTTVIKTFDHSEMREMNGDKIEKFQQKLSEPTDDAKVDTPRAQFLDLIQQLKDAYANGDTETAQAIRDQLDELRQTVFLNMRNSQY